MLKAEIIGNLGADAVKNQSNDGTYVSFRVAHSAQYTDKTTGEVTKTTAWVSCTLNGDGGGLFAYLKSGEKVYCRGNLSCRIYLGHDGQRHAGLNLSVQEIELVGSRAKYTAQEVYERLKADAQFNEELTNLCQGKDESQS